MYLDFFNYFNKYVIAIFFQYDINMNIETNSRKDNLHINIHINYCTVCKHFFNQTTNCYVIKSLLKLINQINFIIFFSILQGI